jgi:hypothetical protein
VRAGRHGQADRAEEQAPQLTASAHSRDQAEGVVALAQESVHRVVGHDVGGDLHVGVAPPGALGRGGDEILLEHALGRARPRPSDGVARS